MSKINPTFVIARSEQSECGIKKNIIMEFKKFGIVKFNVC